MSARKSWIGVDFDGTLAYHEEGAGLYPLGEPIPRMHLRVLWMLQDGVDVRILTARVSPTSCAGNGVTVEQARKDIEAWCLKYLGKVIPVTCEKDFAMKELWDDRAIQVVRNTGERADGKQ